MQILDGKIYRNEVNKKSKGGTELQTEEMVNRLGERLVGFQIIVSRLRDELRDDKWRILWCHDLEKDNETFHLKNEGWKNFHKIVFVSHWQQQRFIEEYKIPWSRTCVIKNAINPIDVDLDEKYSVEKETVNLIYHTTPHRGLHLLLPVVDKLSETQNIHLDVYSSFKIYGWDEKDKDPGIKKMFDFIKEHDHMTYHGTKSNREVHKALAKADIFAYPSVWLETSCISLMEAMSAGCFCIHPNNGALYETAANWTYMYGYLEDQQSHANFLYNLLEQAIPLMSERFDGGLGMKLHGQKSYADLYYGWEVREQEWANILQHIKQLPKAPVEKKGADDGVFQYSVG